MCAGLDNVRSAHIISKELLTFLNVPMVQSETRWLEHGQDRFHGSSLNVEELNDQ